MSMNDDGASSLTQESQQRHVRVGIGVIVKDPTNENKFFCGIRKGSHGAGTLALPGGHLEMYETWDECARREVLEEMGISIEKIRFGHVVNSIMKSEGKHYITIFMMGEFSDIEKDGPKTMEPEKCEGWNAYSWNDLKRIHKEGKTKLFEPLAQLIMDEPETVLVYLKKRLSVV